jgi:DNA-directed RNA polymerase specialized sigma24 family protein
MVTSSRDLLHRGVGNTLGPLVESDEVSVFVGPSSDADDIDGLELSQAARQLGVSVDEVWRRIRNGALVARTSLGKVHVYTDATQMNDIEGLPPLPKSSLVSASTDGTLKIEPLGIEASLETGLTNTLRDHIETTQRQEVALLIDHLSLAKEENREILRLTHDSMARLTEMTDKILEMKDTIIASKEEQMSLMKQRFREQSEELLNALKEKEDLETLTQALQKQ